MQTRVSPRFVQSTLKPVVFLCIATMLIGLLPVTSQPQGVGSVVQRAEGTTAYDHDAQYDSLKRAKVFERH